MNIDHDSYNYIDGNNTQTKSRFSKKTILTVLAVLGCIGIIACGISTRGAVQSHPDGAVINLWERECFTCVKCKDDQLNVISVTYGDKVVTGEFVH
jgi:hypothetical protein